MLSQLTVMLPTSECLLYSPHCNQLRRRSPASPAHCSAERKNKTALDRATVFTAKRLDGRKEDCCSAASKNAESRQPASCYAERSAQCPAGALSLKQNGPFQGSSFHRPVMIGSSPPLLLAEASPLQKEFLQCSSGTLSCAILKMINICYSTRGCHCEHRHPTTAILGMNN
jgi:hypothetical protein